MASEAHFNKLTAGEDERLAFLTEELGETLQAIGKVQRHGYESKDPTLSEPKPTNRCTLGQELGNVFAAVHLLVIAGDLDYATIEAWRDRKLASVGPWMHHQAPKLER